MIKTPPNCGGDGYSKARLCISIGKWVPYKAIKVAAIQVKYKQTHIEYKGQKQSRSQRNDYISHRW